MPSPDHSSPLTGRGGAAPVGDPETVLVVPCYNEEVDLEPGRFEDFVRTGGARILFVDDGSTDRTPALLAALRARVPDRIDVLTLPENSGKAEAVRMGMLRAFGLGPAYVGYWDADLATPLEEVPRFRAILEDDARLLLVMGSRVKLLGRNIERRVLRHYGGRVFATLASMTLGLPVYDTQCGAKLFRHTEVTEDLFAEPFVTGWVFDVELLARLVRKCGPEARDLVVESPLRSWRDVGVSSVRSIDFFRSLAALVKIRRRYGGRRA